MGTQGPPARRAARLVAVAAQRAGPSCALPGQAASSEPWISVWMAATPLTAKAPYKPALAKAGGRNRHIVTDTGGLLVGAEVHPADLQDRDGARLVIEAVHQLFPWLRHLFADSVYNGPNMREALA